MIAHTKAQPVAAGGALWETPAIPPIPQTLEGVETPTCDLNDREGIKWRFLPESPLQAPSPYEADQDFDFSAWREKAWSPVAVPGELVMQGFPIENNTEYYYQREVVVPREFEGKRVFLRFDGVYSNARVWVDGVFVRSHTGGFTSWDCELTGLAKPGAQFCLTVGIADLEGEGKGTYNPDGSQTLGDPSWASYYAHHNIGGILRDVTLFALPQDYLLRLYTDVRFDAEYCDAELDITAQMAGTEEGTLLRLFLEDAQGATAAQGEITFAGGDGARRLTIPVKEPLHWDAEHPNLYTLRSELMKEGKLCGVYEQKVGFRQIQFAGRGGTDRNKIYVNGREVKLRGTCRHDVSYRLGRSTTREEDWEEIRAYKDCNINHVRTSHYPASRYFLEACDALGMYVEQENAACFQGANGYEIHCGPEAFLGPFAEMVERDRNHPGILMWSLGNESGFDQTEAFRQEYDYIRAVDDSRPVVFSYPFTVVSHPRPYDIFSRHYEWVQSPLGSPTVPVLHDEYMHIACYNLEELKRDPNVRNFWGHSIKAAWKKIFTTDGALGGDLWGGVDDVFFLPDKKMEKWQSHSEGRAVGYGEWGSVLDVHKRRKPEAYLTKKAYSPIRLEETKGLVLQNQLLLPIKNWFDHTNLSECTLRYRVDDGKEQEGVLPTLPPHSEGTLIIKGDWEGAARVHLNFYTPDGLLADEYEVSLANEAITRPPFLGGAPCLEETEKELLVSGQGFSLRFDKRNARLIQAERGGEPLLTGGPHLHITGSTLGSWLAKPDGFHVVLEKDCAVVTLQGRYENGQEVTFTLHIFGDGGWTTEYLLLLTENARGLESKMYADAIDEIGISYDIPPSVEKVSWERKALYSVYPEDHIGRPRGTAYRYRAQKAPEGCAEAPTWSWKDDMHNDYLYAPGDPENGRATHDFKTMREHVIFYEAFFEDRKGSIRVESDAQAAARVQLFTDSAGKEHARLLVNHQWCYAELGWGNWTGDPISLSSGSYGAMCLRLKGDVAQT